MGVEVPLQGGASGSASAKTTIDPFMTRSSSNTETEKDVSEFFSNEGGSMVDLEGACSVHVVDLVPNMVPLFNEGFAKAIGKLDNATTKAAQKYAFKEFYRNYGTHYSQRITMGAKLVYSLRISRDERAQNNEHEISKCANVQGLKVFGVQLEPNTEKCKKEKEYKSTIESSYVGREVYASFGSKPKSTMPEWAKQEFNKPMPLTMQLVPLPRLFTEENLAAISKITKVDIDQKSLLDWYLPMWEKYCETVGIPCKVDGKGCGYNDKCTWDQVCKPAKNKEGYKCESVKPCNKFSVEQGTSIYGGTDLGDQIGHGGTAKVTCNKGFGPVYSIKDENKKSGTTFTCRGTKSEPFLPNACHANRDYEPTEKSTGCNEASKGIIYLDRHTVDCGGGDINV